MKLVTLEKLQTLVNKIKTDFAAKSDVTITSIKVNGTAQTIAGDKSVDITIPAQSNYTIIETTTTTGYAKTYTLTKDNVEIGTKINIPKDLVVSSGSVQTVTTADVPYSGAVVGDKYVDLTLNDPNENHIYIPVNDLVDAYTGGNGINVSNGNVISVVTDGNNGMSVTSSGVSLSLATTSTAGAMSSADKSKLNGITKNTATLATSGWTASGNEYVYTVTDNNITSNSEVIVMIAKSSYSTAIEAEVQEPITVSSGSFTMYANSVPSANISISYITI